MVLGFILYEAAEYPEVQREIRAIEDVEELNKRLERLEKLLEDKKD